MGEPQDDILELIERGEKVKAIKLAREHLGLGLAEAKELVEGLGRDARDVPGAAAAGADDEVDRLLRARKKIDAVRAYRERAGCGLKEAKDAIELRAVELGLQSRPSKCFIATAACGGGEQADVAALRRYRNRVLKPSPFGRVLIRAYERISPPVAWIVGRSEWMAWCVRWLVARMVRLRHLQETTRPPRP